MSEAQDMLDDGLRMQEDITGNPTIIYRGWHIPCTFSAVDRGMTLGAGGYDEEIQLTAIIRKSAHPTRTADSNEAWTADSDTVPTGDEDLLPPHPNKTAVALKRKYRIIKVVEDSVEAAWKVYLGTATK